MKRLQPEGWPRPRGYSAGVAGTGTIVFISGQVGWDSEGRFVCEDLVGQTAQALRNVLAVLAEAGGSAQHVARLTWYVTDTSAYLASQRALGMAYRRVMGRNYPAMSVVEVSRLVEAEALVEIEATALIP